MIKIKTFEPVVVTTHDELSAVVEKLSAPYMNWSSKLKFSNNLKQVTVIFERESSAIREIHCWSFIVSSPVEVPIYDEKSD